MTTKRKVGIFVFDGVEVLDFAGPFEVFSRTRLEAGQESRAGDTSAPFDVFLIAQDTAKPVVATGGLKVVADYAFDDAPKIDVLVIPGGFGTRGLVDDDSVIDWIKRKSIEAQKTCSVCTGALLLAKAGLLNKKRAATHWGAIDLLAGLGDNIMVERNRRFVDDGVVTSAGVSAGIDMALYLVAGMCGEDVATDTARFMDYAWVRDSAGLEKH